MKEEKYLKKKLSVAILKLYDPKENDKNRAIFLSKIFITEDKNGAFDILSGEEYKIYDLFNGTYLQSNNGKNKLESGDMFCVIEKELDEKTDIIEYMIDSPDYFYQRLPYLQEKFRLFSKEKSSYVFPLLKKYQQQMREDSENMIVFKEILQNKRNNSQSFVKEKKKTLHE